jgi:FSR family fosmidomycin resistance protein-like MFS transporter
VSASHLLNDTVQSLLPAIYPLLETTFALELLADRTDDTGADAHGVAAAAGGRLLHRRKPAPYALVVGMGFSLVGLLTLSAAWSYPAAPGRGSRRPRVVGVPSESSRVARMASGGRHGFAQSLFQVGGNAGSSLGPLLAAFLVAPYGQTSLAWCAVVALAGMALTFRIGRWYELHPSQQARGGSQPLVIRPLQVSPARVMRSIAILAALIFSKYFYMASLSSYFTFYLITKFGVSVRSAQLYLFVFLAAVAAGTFLGGPVGDRIGRKPVIWSSILGVLPFSLALPYVDLFWTRALSIVIGLILASAFSAIVIMLQNLCQAASASSQVSSLDSRSAWVDWEPRHSVGSPTIGIKLSGLRVSAAIGLLAAFLPNLDKAGRTLRGGRPAMRALRIAYPPSPMHTPARSSIGGPRPACPP